MKNMKTKKTKNAVKKHENTPNQSTQKRGARKRIYVLNNRQRPITPAASVGQHNKTSICSCSFEPEIIKIVQSSHKMYRNNIMNLKLS